MRGFCQMETTSIYFLIIGLWWFCLSTLHLQGDLDSVLQSVIDSQADGTVHKLCPEAAAILLELVRTIISRVRTGQREVCPNLTLPAGAAERGFPPPLHEVEQGWATLFLQSLQSIGSQPF